MKISRIYSNKIDLFESVNFNEGLNVVLAEIRLSENRDKDTHNLGKSTLARILDFCFLAKRNPRSFLFKHLNLFQDFEFFLELEIAPASFLTIKRTIKEASKVCFKKHGSRHQDFSHQSDEVWDHLSIPFDRAVKMLDAFINWDALKPWNYRKGVGYLLRSQEDYSEVFRLKKFAGKHADWKPYLAHVLGFNAALVSEHYAVELKLAEQKSIETTVKSELGGSVEDNSEIEGLLLLKQQDSDKKQRLLDAFDFREGDKETNQKIVEDIDRKISDLNTRKYSLSSSKKRINESINEDQILFKPEEAHELFKQSGILFDGQIKKDFDQLIKFNRLITDERQQYLLEERLEIEAELSEVSVELNTANENRSASLKYLFNTDALQKYKALSSELVVIKADIEGLERQRKFVERLQDLKKYIRELQQQATDLQSKIEADVAQQNSTKESLFSKIRVVFSDIVERVIDRKALLVVKPNDHGHLDFSVSILNDEGIATSADTGHTYKKLLCIAFDLAIIKAHIGDSFPTFAFHDGVFESLDNRKKTNLLEVLRQLGDLGIQHIITTIDSDLPPHSLDDPIFTDSEVALTLHDEGDEGRLFKFNSW